MRVLVTGASGFVGVNLVAALLARGHDVHALSADALPVNAVAGWRSLPGRLVDETGDVCDTGAMAKRLRDGKFDAIWHGAAITANLEREKREARRILEVNLLATVDLVEAAARSGVRRFVYPSSSSVYGQTTHEGTAPMGEDEPLQPFVLYGISKMAAEKAVLHLARERGLEACAGRINAVFGPWERDTGLRDTLSPHLNLFFKAREGREAILARGGERDWVYAPDVADAFVAMLEAPSVPYLPMNISMAERWNLEVMAKALAASPLALRWRFANEGEETNLRYGSPLHPPRRALSNARITQVLGWKPKWTPETACADYVGWLQTR